MNAAGLSLGNQHNEPLRSLRPPKPDCEMSATRDGGCILIKLGLFAGMHSNNVGNFTRSPASTGGSVGGDGAKISPPPFCSYTVSTIKQPKSGQLLNFHEHS
jgi:hypothetical protein